MSVETSFAIGAVQGHVPAAPGQMPQYIQFRLNGVDIGGPTVSVVDFVGASFVVTRGTGADVNKLTVSLG